MKEISDMKFNTNQLDDLESDLFNLTSFGGGGLGMFGSCSGNEGNESNCFPSGTLILT